MTKEDELWARACDGDQAAWIEVVRSLHGRVHRFFTYKVVDEDVADLTQQTISSFIEARARFEGRSGVRAYVLGIAYNLLCAYIRRRTIRGSVADPDEVSAADLAPRPSSVLRMKEDRRLLLGALHLLPISMQTLIELFYFDELTTAQIATLLGIPDNTVRGRLSRARARLRELVEAGPAAVVLARDDDDELGDFRAGYTRALADDDDE